ncbi:hypothetical protein EPO15_14300 [bacterium]|nr:MAG: hypothetical protein EPO15_14300 [bacterium]
MKKKRAPAPEAPPPAPPRSSLAALSALAAAAGLGAWLGLGFVASAAATYDEPLHLASGWSYLTTGRYFLNITDHPPLAEMWAALPLAALKPAAMTGHPDFAARRRYAFADRFLYGNTVDAERLLNTARRFNFLTLFLGLAAVLALWARRLSGWEAAAGAVAAAALSPVLVSNLALVTTDGLPAVLFAASFWLLSRPERDRAVWAAAGAAAGLAMAGKFSMASLAPLAPVLVLAERRLRGERPFSREALVGLLVWAAAAALAVAAVYRFGQAGLFFEGLRETLSRLDQGRSSYLLGRHTVRGTLAYFPAALFAKTPLALLALSGWGAWTSWRRERPEERLWLLAPPAAFFALALTAKVQIGVRHLLPVLPFLALWCGLAAADLARRGAAARLALAALALWAGASVVGARPHLLSYFNEAAGGPAGGREWLLDSNLDWGQDLKGLAAELKARGNPPVYLAYFGVADPAYYGIRYVQALANWNVPRPGDDLDPAAGGGPVLFAVSATNLKGVYLSDHGLLSWLESRAPVAAPGQSILLYDLSSDLDGRRRLAELLALSRHPAAAGLSKGLLLQ